MQLGSVEALKLRVYSINDFGLQTKLHVPLAEYAKIYSMPEPTLAARGEKRNCK